MAESMRGIGDIITTVSRISASISGAVEEQSAATRDVSSNIAEVREAAEANGRSAGLVLDVAQAQSALADQLRVNVQRFLVSVRTM